MVVQQLRNSGKFWLVLFLIGIAAGGAGIVALADCYEDLIVTGAGHANANGTYEYSRILDGKPSYEGGVEAAVMWVAGADRWEFEDVSGMQRFKYANNANTPTPPSTGWYVVLEPGPAPTVSGGGPCCTAPVLSGTPPDSVDAGRAYSFQPSVSEGCPPLVYSIVNKPTWASFSTATGRLSGTPSGEHVGTYEGIIITVTDDESNTDAIGPFSITVEYVPSQLPVIQVTPSGAGGDSVLDHPLPLDEGVDPPMVGTQPLCGTFEAGETITGGCTICGADGTPLRASFIHIYVYSVDVSAVPETVALLTHWTEHYDAATGQYRFEITTEGWAPGYYDLRLSFADGSAQVVRIQLTAAPG